MAIGFKMKGLSNWRGASGVAGSILFLDLVEFI